MTQKIAVIGECMVELSAAGEGLLAQGFGGDTLNTALYLARLTRTLPLSVHYVTALGEDGLSENMLAAWQQEHIQTNWVQRLGHKSPGLYLIETDPHGERHFSYWRSDSAARYWLSTEQSEEIVLQLQECDYLYLSGISLAILATEDRIKLLACLKKARVNGAKVIFDNNYRPKLWKRTDLAQTAYREVLQETDIALLTLEDDLALWQESDIEQVIARSQAFGVPEIVIKRGEQPCVIVNGEQRQEVSGVKLAAEQVIDTTAAGDSFSAGYLAARLRGFAPEKAATWGHELAAAVIQHPGAIIKMNDMPAILTGI